MHDVSGYWILALLFLIGFMGAGLQHYHQRDLCWEGHYKACVYVYGDDFDADEY